jgi:hypothetical protein
MTDSPHLLETMVPAAMLGLTELTIYPQISIQLFRWQNKNARLIS